MSVIKIKPKQYTGKVLILGEDNRSFLTVIRSLGRRNLCVHVGWCPPSSSALYSKYVAKVHDIPPYSPHDDSWKHSLISVLQQEQFDLVIPCNDRTIIPFQIHRTDLERFASIYLLNEQAFEVAFDKFKTNELAKSLGIPIPQGIKISNSSEVGAILSEFQFPLVLKPRASFSAQDLVNRNLVRKAYNKEELNAYLESMLQKGAVLIQENFIGTGVGVELLVDRGELLLAFQHVRVHEPLTGGGSSYRKSVSLHPKLLAAAIKLMKALNYTGVAMVEFKVNFKTNDWALMEINGRFWGSLPLAVSTGADFPYYLYQLIVEGKREFSQNYKRGIYCRNLLGDLRWMLQNLKEDRSNPTLATLPLWQVAKEGINILTFRERSDTFVMDDPKPAFVELAYLAHILTMMALDKSHLFLLSQPPIRKLYVDKARRALSIAKRVLFVCKGNICRSPFAQYYCAQAVFQGSAEVMSCGYYPEKGRVCPKEAVNAAKAMGVDLSAHRSSVISEEIVRQAQVIFIFDEENSKTLITRYPFATRKTYRIGLLAQEGPISIKDPYGGTINDFKETYQTIICALDSYKNSCTEDNK